MHESDRPTPHAIDMVVAGHSAIPSQCSARMAACCASSCPVPPASTSSRARTAAACHTRSGRPAGRTGRPVRRPHSQPMLPIGCASTGRPDSGNRRPLFLRPAARRARSASAGRRPPSRTRPTASARMSWRSTASPACASRSGRRMRARVSVVGDFNGWDGRRHPMRCVTRPACGSCSSPACGPARSTNTKCSARTAAAAAEGRSGGAGRPKPPPAPPRSSPTRAACAGPTRPGCDGARPPPSAGCADLDLRGACRLLAARATAASLDWDALADQLDPLCRRHGLHPCRAAADHGASVRRLLGLPAARPVRAAARSSARPRHSPASSIAATTPASA